MLPARLPKSAVPATYTWIAPVYDLLALAVTPKARRLALERAAVRDGEQVLEVAVGTGLSFRELLLRNPNGWTEGVDLSPAMLRRARRRAAHTGVERYRLSAGDAYALPFPDARFDLVLNCYMFDLLPEQDFTPVLREFSRVLRPGGRLVLVNMTAGKRWYNRIWDGIYRLHPALLGGCRCVTSEPYVVEAGYQDVHREYVSHLTYPSEVIFGRKPPDRL